jgi:hypothetical protein
VLTQTLNEAPADQRTSQIEERLVDIGSPLVAYLQVPVAVQPRQRALRHPPMLLQLLTALIALSGYLALDTASPQRLSALLCAVGLK